MTCTLLQQSNINRSVESVDDNLNAVSSAAELARASHDIDTDRQLTFEVDVTHTDINRSVESVDDNLNAISSTADAMNGEHTFDESITIADTLSLSQHSELIQTVTSNGDYTGTDGAIEPTKSAEYVESGLRPFPHAFKLSYCRRAISTMGVPSIRIDLSQWFIAYIVVRIIQRDAWNGNIHKERSDHFSRTVMIRVPSAAFTLDVEKPCITPGDWMNRLTTGSSTQDDIVNDSSYDDHMDLRGRLRPRKPKEPKRRVKFTKQHRRGNSSSEQDVIENQQGSGRPVIFAVSQPWSSSQRRNAKPAMDVARFIAGRLSTNSMSDTPMLAALSLMKIEYWLQDVANDCNKALEADDMTLSPLARHGLIELAKRASTDAASLSEALEIYISATGVPPGRRH
ncbi:hypothetical protein F4604DRAFT_1686087 [Suillus subluteus]|nr:hypothetical protein F4604DRAFT_1686087 [Suillus subluteus]